MSRLCLSLALADVDKQRLANLLLVQVERVPDCTELVFVILQHLSKPQYGRTV